MARVRTGLLAALLLAVTFGCGDPRDERDHVRERRGEPDDITRGGAGPYWYEVWHYREDGKYYEFRRSAPKCGGGYDYYLYATYYDDGLGKGASARGDTLYFVPELEDTNPLGP